MSAFKMALVFFSFPACVAIAFQWGAGRLTDAVIYPLAVIFVGYLINAYQAGKK